MPRLFLFTDPVRLPDPLAAASRLPRGAGVVARGVPPATLARLARLLRARGGVLLVAGDGRAALRCRAGLHLPERGRHPVPGLLAFLRCRRNLAPWASLSLAAHGGFAAPRRFRRLRADLAFLSPAFPTRSHPGAPALGPLRWSTLSRGFPGPVAALGGIEPRSAARLPARAAALAAIGALDPSGRK